MMYGWRWFWGAFMMLVFWGGLAVVVVVAARMFGRDDRRSSRRIGDAEGILEERFARGEISQEEFEQRRSVLRS